MTSCRIFARGLCRACYDRARYNGTLHQFPVRRPQLPRAHFVADYRLLRSEGYTHAQMAARLGMKRRSFYAAYARAVNAGELTPHRRVA